MIDYLIFLVLFVIAFFQIRGTVPDSKFADLLEKFKGAGIALSASEDANKLLTEQVNTLTVELASAVQKCEMVNRVNGNLNEQIAGLTDKSGIAFKIVSLEQRLEQAKRQNQLLVDEANRMETSRNNATEHIVGLLAVIEHLNQDILDRENARLMTANSLSLSGVLLNPPVVEGNRYIYIYTDPDKKANNKYKVGDTRRDPRLRVDEQNSTGNSDEFELVAYFHSPWSSDKDIHDRLPGRVRANREWFALNDPIVQVRQAIVDSDTRILAGNLNPAFEF